ncbi:hypothetical protein [Mesorhizobium sp. CA7]|uniref:hypothetical protein n=1 Tax=Mesorhizobium sp. CA7 TaxID=588501 RepID=UPI001CCCA090|nr:hypothetical protein [Mesorhizobium sp. CA7]MBZ9812481.1 hypothetical protein [Mesorhizobium sp. CA7]
MKNAAIAIVSSVIGGVIIALFNYTFLRDRPEIPRIDIQQTTSAIPVDTAKSILLPNAIGNSDFFSGVYAIETFDIKNNGDKIYKGVLFRATDFETAVIQHEGKTENLTGDKQLDMNPGDTITVSGVSRAYKSPYGITNAGKLFAAVGDIPIPIRSSAIDETSPISPIIAFAIDNPFTAYMAVMLMVLFSVLVVVALFVVVATTLHPQMKFRIFSNKTFSEELAYLTFMQRYDPERYEEVSKMAERYEKKKLPKIVEAIK